MILKALCDWQFDESEEIRDLVRGDAKVGPTVRFSECRLRADYWRPSLRGACARLRAWLDVAYGACVALFGSLGEVSLTVPHCVVVVFAFACNSGRSLGERTRWDATTGSLVRS